MAKMVSSDGGDEQSGDGSKTPKCEKFHKFHKNRKMQLFRPKGTAHNHPNLVPKSS
jgi:hypothetical protein